MNAIYILWLRQLKRYSRSRARMVMSMMQPLMFLAALGMGFSPVFRKAGEGNYLQFLGPGVIAMSVMFTGVFSGIEILWDRQFGFLKETLVAPVSRLQIVFGRTLGSATVAVFQGILMLIICLIAGVRLKNPAMFPVAILFMFLIAIFFTAIGTVAGSLMEDMQGFQLVTNVLVMPLFFFSNALFPLTGLSRPLRLALHANPLVYGMDGLRGSIIGTFSIGAGLDALILGALAAIILALAAWSFSRIQL